MTNNVISEIQNKFSSCADFAKREAKNKAGSTFTLFYIINLCQKQYVSESIIKPLILSDIVLTKENITSQMAALPMSECTDIDTCIQKLLLGNAVVIIEDNKGSAAYAIDSKNDDNRSISEPDSEVVVRGPRQGFIESAEANVTLLRKIIKSTSLKVINKTVGYDSNTSVKVMYYEGIAREDILKNVLEKIDSIKISSCIDSGYLEQFFQAKKHPFLSEVGNSEKPDKVAAKILGGRIAIICDGSPVVLTVPYLFIEGLQSSEDYLKNKFYATFSRILRMLGLIISLYLPAAYVAIIGFHKGALPYSLYKLQTQQRSDIPFGIFTEMLIILTIFELIREVGVRIPKAVGNSLSIVGGLILGDAAIKAGIASETAIMIAALTAICNYMNPTFMNIGVLVRFANLFLAKAFGFFGLSASLILICTSLCSKYSLGVPYLSPIAPINKNILNDTLTVFPKKSIKKEQDELIRYGKK